MRDRRVGGPRIGWRRCFAAILVGLLGTGLLTPATASADGETLRRRHRHDLRAVRIPGRPGQFRRHRHGSHQGHRRGPGLHRRHQAAGLRRGAAGGAGQPGRRRHRGHVDHRQAQAGVRLLRPVLRVRRPDGGAGEQRRHQGLRGPQGQAGRGQERHRRRDVRRFDQGQVRLRRPSPSPTPRRCTTK